MEETPHQPPGHLLPPQGRRFKVGPFSVVLLLILAATGLGLLARTAITDARLASAKEGDVRATKDVQPGDQVASSGGSLQEILGHPDIIPTHHHPLLGRRAPDFELADAEAKVWTLKELQDGQPLVLIFYYGYHCVSCVRQLFDINRELPLFGEVGARVAAISADPPELTRQRFQQHGPFDFQVLSDPGNKVAQAYGVFKEAKGGLMGPILRHGTFVVDGKGTVQWVNVGDAPLRRNSALLYQLAKMTGRLPSIKPILPGGTPP